MSELPNRYELSSDYSNRIPVHAVWEITLACNLKCQHCGSRAGKVRPHELSLEECYTVVEQLAKLGTREITLIGGEAFLRKDWLSIVRKINSAGIDCSMQTGAFNLSEKIIVEAKDAGIKNIGVSIDGLEKTHNRIRGVAHSFSHALHCLETLNRHNITSSVNTVINQENWQELNELLQLFIELKVKNWQLQLAVAMGNAIDNEHLLLQPFKVREIHDRLFVLYQAGLEHNLLVQPGNNIGYFGPYEHMWRQTEFGHYAGCSAGHTLIAIESDGKIKGCPSLPSTDYTGGNIRDMALSDIWKHAHALAFTRHRNKEELWGFCKSCYYADVCLAGCTWTSHVLFGKRGNNPYCYHRASELAKKNLYEKIVKIKSGSGLPFDYGLFEIVVENDKGEIVEKQNFPAQTPQLPEEVTDTLLREPIRMQLCKSCYNYIYQHHIICPFCNENVEASEVEYQQKLRMVNEAFYKIETLLEADSKEMHPSG